MLILYWIALWLWIDLMFILKADIQKQLIRLNRMTLLTYQNQWISRVLFAWEVFTYGCASKANATNTKNVEPYEYV